MFLQKSPNPLPVLVIGASLLGCATVPMGRVGVEWSPLKGTSQKTLAEGIHVVSPAARGKCSTAPGP
jgi:hypothetical protein